MLLTNRDALAVVLKQEQGPPVEDRQPPTAPFFSYLLSIPQLTLENKHLKIQKTDQVVQRFCCARMHQRRVCVHSSEVCDGERC